MKRFVKLFASCVVVKGVHRGFIYDLQRPLSSCAIPLDLCDVLDKHHNKSIEDIKNHYRHKYDETIEEYFQFLLSENLAYCFEKQELVRFPPINMDWISPSLVTNAIIYYSNVFKTSFTQILIQLSQLKCNAVQICFEDASTMEDIRNISALFDGLRIMSVEFFINWHSAIIFTDIAEIIASQPRIRRCWIGNYSGVSLNIDERMIILNNRMCFTANCGTVNTKYFAINLPFFTEAQHHNTCLNRKICIDENGDIKNCPAMKKSYGNIRDTTLGEAINKPGFKDLWYVCKDQIDVCKDCEFRYMCTDCRAFIKDPANPYSQPAKCTYNPYICLWEGQDGYVPVEECGTYSRETGFVPDKMKIAELNRRIWGED